MSTMFIIQDNLAERLIAFTHTASSESSTHFLSHRKQDFRISFTASSTTTLADAGGKSPERARTAIRLSLAAIQEELFRLEHHELGGSSYAPATRSGAGASSHSPTSVVISVVA